MGTMTDLAPPEPRVKLDRTEATAVGSEPPRM